MTDTTGQIYIILRNPSPQYDRVLDSILSDPNPIEAYQELKGDLDQCELFKAVQDRLTRRHSEPSRANNSILSQLYFLLARATIPARY